MKLLELHPIWKEVIACFEALRRLGFTADDLFLSRSPDGRMGMLARSANYLLVANPVGEDAFVFKGRSDPELQAEWREAAALWNASADKPDSMELWEGSTIRRHGIDLIMDLHRHGILVPAIAEA